MAYEMVMPYHLHMPSYFLGTFTEYPYYNLERNTHEAECLRSNWIHNKEDKGYAPRKDS